MGEYNLIHFQINSYHYVIRNSNHLLPFSFLPTQSFQRFVLGILIIWEHWADLGCDPKLTQILPTLCGISRIFYFNEWHKFHISINLKRIILHMLCTYREYFQIYRTICQWHISGFKCHTESFSVLVLKECGLLRKIMKYIWWRCESETIRNCGFVLSIYLFVCLRSTINSCCLCIYIFTGKNFRNKTIERSDETLAQRDHLKSSLPFFKYLELPIFFYEYCKEMNELNQRC